MKDTPLMRQYKAIKKQYPDKIVLFRMGDFYETFGEDARITSKILNITLTKRNKEREAADLAGFPYHALEKYISYLIEAGKCAVVVDQVEDPKEAKGIVKRAVTRVITPGTLDSTKNGPKQNQYILALYWQKNQTGVCIADVYTGEIQVTEIPDSEESLQQIMDRFNPVELVLTEGAQQIELASNILVQFVSTEITQIKEATNIVSKQFNVSDLDALGLEDKPFAVIATAMLLKYITATQRTSPVHIKNVKVFNLDSKMVLDSTTIRSLELVSSNSKHGNIRVNQKDNLFDLLDECQTAMGRRKLHQWILNPLINAEEITKRLDVVDDFSANVDNLDKVRKKLNEISDIERIVARIGFNRVNARDYKALQHSLEQSLQIKELTNNSEIKPILKDIKSFIADIDEIIIKAPPTEITEGGIINFGFNDKVDELRSVSQNIKQWIKEFTESEKKRTDISNLKVDKNRVFGYYIEVTKTQQKKVPDNYERKQTLVNSERYITPELKEHEDIILTSHEKLAQLEYELFQEFREKTVSWIEEIQTMAKKIARLDVLTNFAHIARTNDYIRPIIYKMGSQKRIIEIKAGRHPIVEQISDEPFVANDVSLNGNNERLILLTGPNMSGKSTYIRQVAILVLMAQIGTFIPADSAKISIVDRIFTRVGAYDDLARGRSTFLVEMDEVANITRYATENSLVILDEVGRGTSTYDGVSIAWAISKYLLEEVKTRTMFATHYHELLQLEDEFNGVRNYNVMVEEDNKDGSVLFLRKIVRGGTDRSYGIFVAKMAGLPDEIVEGAYQLLEQFERHSLLMFNKSKINAQNTSSKTINQKVRKDDKSKEDGAFVVSQTEKETENGSRDSKERPSMYEQDMFTRSYNRDDKVE